MSKSKCFVATLAPLLFFAALAGQANAGLIDSISIGYSPRTGDVWVDARLSEINDYGRNDLPYFVDDVSSSYGVPRNFIQQLAYERDWSPGDIHMACALAYQLRMPCQEVVQRYGQDRGQGWGAIAKRMGIKPGSVEFHALKGQVGKSHGKFKNKGAVNKNARVQPQHNEPSSHGQGKPDHAGGKGKGKDKGKGGGL